MDSLAPLKYKKKTLQPAVGIELLLAVPFSLAHWLIVEPIGKCLRSMLVIQLAQTVHLARCFFSQLALLNKAIDRLWPFGHLCHDLRQSEPDRDVRRLNVTPSFQRARQKRMEKRSKLHGTCQVGGAVKMIGRKLANNLKNRKRNSWLASWRQRLASW